MIGFMVSTGPSGHRFAAGVLGTDSGSAGAYFDPANGKDLCLQAARDLSEAFPPYVLRTETFHIRDDVKFFQAVRATMPKRAANMTWTSDTLDSFLHSGLSAPHTPQTRLPAGQTSQGCSNCPGTGRGVIRMVGDALSRFWHSRYYKVSRISKMLLSTVNLAHLKANANEARRGWENTSGSTIT